jgi:hypothetical protein
MDLGKTVLLDDRTYKSTINKEHVQEEFYFLNAVL